MQTEYVKPPGALLTPCRPPQARELRTNADLILFASEAVRAYEVCAAQVAGIREFFELDTDEKSGY